MTRAGQSNLTDEITVIISGSAGSDWAVYAGGPAFSPVLLSYSEVPDACSSFDLSNSDCVHRAVVRQSVDHRAAEAIRRGRPADRPDLDEPYLQAAVRRED